MAEAFRSSTSRPVGLRYRGDLVTNRQVYQGQAWYVVKDPIGLSYYRFRPEEYALLEMLDGEASLEDLKDNFEARFPPRRITVDEVSRFVSTLHRSGLVIGDRPGQGPQLNERRRQRVWSEWKNWLRSIMCLRFRGIDPDWILNKLNPWFGWLYSPPALMVAVVYIFTALMLVLVNFETFRSKLPEFHQFFASGNWFYLAAALGITKVIHEFGHGLSCKYYGGECHEMGFMLLVFTPCLYCDVSDSWMLPSKWKRMMIGAGGMYIELIIASTATFLWWNSHEGLFNQMCLNVMFVSSVSTLLFNANPLMRFDGYYILSDMLEIPNLRTKSSTSLSRLAKKWCLGVKLQDDPFLPKRHQGLFALYSVASTIYMWVLMISIFMFVWNAMKPYRMEAIGRMLALFGIYGLIVRPITGIYKFLKVPGRRDEVKSLNITVTAGVVAVIAAAICFIPLPQRVWCPAELRPRGEETVYVTVDGRLEEILVEANDRVAEGDELARFSNVDLELQIAELEGQESGYRARLASLERERFTDSAAGMEIRTVEESLKSVEEQLVKKRQYQSELVLKAPRSGLVLPSETVDEKPDPSGRLPGWSGSALAKKNIGATFAEGTVLCMVGDPDHFEAVMIVDQSEVEFVQIGQRVDLKLDAFPFETFRGAVNEIAETHIEVGSERLSVKAGGSVPTTTDEMGREVPISTSYEVLMQVDDAENVFTPGMRGNARVEVGNRTVGQWLLRLFWQTFNFRM
ncbi:MAG: biotin/lipoyl-binding protein [Pirellulales bacterium]|nr:biotin/lipoyl-binding protein [Pirellulales bacterium]MDA7992613.1 biotin/lipoyl-binding protein [Pirellulales bacterium]